MTAKYINPKLPGMIRNLYRDDLGEGSIQTMLNLAGDLIQELIDLRASTEEAKAQAWDEAESAAWRAHERDNIEPWGHMTSNPYRKEDYIE